jgi:Domain of unknown function (DUF4279)
MVSLRFFGDDLEPDFISTLLGASPSSSAKKGEDRIDRYGTKRGIERTGRWLREAANRTPGDLDSQIVELLSPLTSDLAIWRELTDRFSADLYCGLFMSESNDGLELQPDTLAMIGSRGLSLELQLYAPLSPGDGDTKESDLEI